MRPAPLRSPTDIVAGLALAVAAVAAQAGAISPELERAMARRSADADVSVIVRFAAPLIERSPVIVDRRSRDNALFVSLTARSSRRLAALGPFLSGHGASSVKELWIINGFAATLPVSAVKELLSRSDVERIGLDSFVQRGRSQRTPASRSNESNATPLSLAVPALAASDEQAQGDLARAPPSWNVLAVHAPALWARGYLGQGIVLASMDTGVDVAHPELRGKWRGGTNSWFDPHGEEAEPRDALGHGTHSMGVMVGGPAIGLAPAARWIAVRLFNRDGRASMSDIHRGFQWLLDPDGDPATVDSPDVVNASWTLSGPGSGACLMEFSDDVQVLRNAGIGVVFAAGNDGPSPGTSSSPANNPGVLSVGAVDRDLEIARQTSRGPSSCDGEVFPRLVAPGVNVKTADLSHGGQPSYTLASGSSLAAPHVAGTLALLMSAFPSVPADQLEAALVRGAAGGREMGSMSGSGLVDALGAFNILHEGRQSLAAGPPRK